MEKRQNARHRINTSIVCSYVGSIPCSKTFDGRMKNCSSGGLCAELSTQFNAGTILVVRATGRSFGFSRDEGFRCLTLAEVKWSRRESGRRDERYGTGLRYLMV
jgi:hypothetical protein